MHVITYMHKLFSFLDTSLILVECNYLINPIREPCIKLQLINWSTAFELTSTAQLILVAVVYHDLRDFYHNSAQLFVSRLYNNTTIMCRVNSSTAIIYQHPRHQTWLIFFCQAPLTGDPLCWRRLAFSRLRRPA